MKIKALKLYQAVYLRKANEGPKLITHLNAENEVDINMEIVDGVGVLIKSPADAVIVTFNNIASMNPIMDEPKKASKKSEA